jgi:DNA polymerase I-like protein with 3'-5' exonuclease and polymerase domains
MRLLFDLESNGFLAQATKVHCVVTIDLDTGDEQTYGPDAITEAVSRLQAADEVAGHNIQRFDLPVLRKLHNYQPKAGQKTSDTLIISSVVYPNLKASDAFLKDFPSDLVGKHSIKAWGHRLGVHKGDYAQVRRAQAIANGITDEKAIAEFVWGAWSQEMQDYCVQDCRTNFTLWKKLRPDGYPGSPLALEHRVGLVCDAIEAAGVPFDVAAAQTLHVQLTERKHALETALKEKFGFWYQPSSPDPNKSLFVPKRDNKKLGYVAGQESTKLKLVEFNPGSRQHIARKLIERGWEPEKFTDGGQPQLDEETIEGVVARFPEMEGIGELLMVEKRLSQLHGSKQSLMDSVGEDGRIHGAIAPMGTITSRCSHFKPNLAQVPSVKKPYGADFRKLFHAPDGWKFVGADMQGLELRGLAHYLSYYDGGAYGKTVLEGDVHWTNAEAMGLVAPGTTRDKHNQLHTIVREDGSKRFIYAYVYGAGDEMCGSIIYETLVNAKNNAGDEGAALYREFFGEGAVDGDKLKSVGRKIRKTFAKRITGFGTLQRDIAARVEAKGYIKGLDGRLTPIRASHSALNFLIQGAGAILTKRWISDAFEECCSRFEYGKDFTFALFIHDEVDVLVREGLEEEIGNTLVTCARNAGKAYGFRIELDSEAKIGRTWYDIH